MHDSRVIIVTGGGSGIGRMVVEIYAADSWTVVTADMKGGDGVGRPVDNEAFIRADVSRPEDSEQVVQECRRRYGRIDALVHCAGILNREADYHDIERVIAVNLFGPLILSRCTAPVMIANGGGVITMVGSIVGYIGSIDHPAYSASKAALVGLTRSLARKYARNGIRANCVCPGSIAGTNLRHDITDGNPQLTQQEYLGLIKKIPIGRVGTPTDVAWLIHFLTSDKAAHISGAIFTIDGGEMINV
jgi:NAD(P)-dependent dehydrogenase (short-subunit alcohol dehydrogenase family)